MLHGVWRLFRLTSPWPRLFLGLVARIVGARARVIGTPLRRDVVFVSNHQSWVDILVIAGTTGSAFVAKSDLRSVPLVGWLCTLNHTIFVSREDRLGIAAQIDQLRAALAQAWPVTLFPEGTTGDGTTLLPFKASLFEVLDTPPTGVMVQPIRIDYGDAMSDLAWLGDEPGQVNATRVLRRSGSFPTILHFCEPFDPATFDGRKAIAAEARRRIETR
ncbi:lysophospholipid acyltransferase family protein [Sphingomonas oligophenolica]|uniref:lysophospholipid acyltransferase family protein n=1 Tax=Sphingomonas oligophenolica TaxID=301154 RepID=UPI001F4FAF77|nr:lysophospholipid acyltransferase family protein [Sphingomonas oligophenolica]